MLNPITKPSVSRRLFLYRLAGLSGSLWFGTAANRLHAGVTMHHVVKGDSLSEIAVRYGTSVRELKQINGLNSDLIRTGQRLKVRPLAGSLPPTALRELEGIKIARTKWRHLVVHHSATAMGNAKSFDRYHRQRGMENGLAYHFVIGNGNKSGDGQIEVGSRWRGQLNGGHVKNNWYNTNSIGICLVGNFEKYGPPTAQQLSSLYRLIAHLKQSASKKPLKILVHKEIKGEQTLCPGQHFPLNDLHKRFS